MGLGSIQEPHRPGCFKQQNKSHKSGRHRSKRAIDKEHKGKVSLKVWTNKAKRELKKEERRHQASQLRKNKREEVLLKKRALGSASAPPHLTAIVSLCHDIDPYGAVALLKQSDPDAIVEESTEGTIHISCPRFKHRFAFVVPPPGNLYCVLDSLKVADTVLFLLSAASPNGLDSEGEILIYACMAQGLPSVLVSLVHSESIPPKKRHDVKIQVQKGISKWLPDVKVWLLEKYSDGLNILHRISAQKQRSLSFRDRRPHLLGESIVYEPNDEGSLGTLKVSGYIRGLPLSVNSLVHIVGWGDFQMSHITAPDDPFPLVKSSKTSNSDQNDMPCSKETILAVADSNIQESLVSENIPDPMEGEQTWPTEEELKEAEENQKANKLVKRIPKGMSEYQAAWIPDCDAEEIISDVSDDEDEEEAMDVKSETESEASNSESEEEYESVTVSEFGGDAKKYDAKMDLTIEEEERQKLKDARMEELFPDEVDVTSETPARIRFQKYRGLKSFRTSPWDPKENLPLDYAKIFQFQNFQHTRKRVFHNSREQEGALPGWYVTLFVKNVPKSMMESRNATHPLILYGMLPHEQKISVLNFLLKRPNMVPYEMKPIKSKEELIFHCGYRRFKCCPIFSQHTNGTKHKFERYFQPDATVVATSFAPILFPPCATIVFKENKDGSQDLVAVGNILSVNPDRIVAKRIILTGHPFKIHTKSSVIRFMFYNREDIEWFKPVELKTKYGRHGLIKEPLGTHGHMKCEFDGQLRSQDTVLMCLYKRVFPKWTYNQYLDVPPSLYNSSMCEEYMDEDDI